MNGPSGGLTGILDTVLRLVGVHLEPWHAPVAVVIAALLFSPFIYRNQSTAKSRRVMGRLAVATTAVERAAIEAEALALVTGNADGLVSLADIAVQRGRTELARTCLAQVRALGTRPAEVRRLTRLLDGDFPATVAEVEVRIDTQMAAGLEVAAAETLARAEQTWPHDAALARLRARHFAR